jgi:transcriptional accessory protein Tex/SPT6
VVNLVGLDLNELNKNEHIQNQLQFISGLGPKKSFALLERLKEQSTEILNRNVVEKMVRGKIVGKNCTPFFKI